MNFSRGRAAFDVHRLFVTNAGWLWLDQILRAIITLVSFGAMARHLGPDKYGILSFALTYPGIFAVLATLSLDYVIVHELVQRRADTQAILATSFTLRLGAAGFALGAAYAGLHLLAADHPAREPAKIAMLILLQYPIFTFDCWFQSNVKSRYAVLARLFSSVFANGLRLYLVYRQAPFEYFVWVSLLDAALLSLSLLLSFRLVHGPFPFRFWRDFQSRIARRMLRAIWPLFLADIAIMGYMKFDQLLLGQVAGTTELGRYAAAFRLADAVEIFALALINSYFPRLVAQHAEGDEVFQAGFRSFFAALTWVAITLAAGVTIVSPWATRLVLGRQFTDVWPILVALTWANVFATQIAVRGKWFLMERWQLYSLAFFAIGAALHLAGVWFIAPRWGALGAALSFAFAQFAMALLAPALFPRTRRASSLALRSFWPVKG